MDRSQPILVLGFKSKLFLIFILSILITGCGGVADSPQQVDDVTASPTLGEEEEGYFRTYVYFGTDREELAADSTFSDNLGDGTIHYGRVDVSIPGEKYHKSGRIERPKWYNFWDNDNPKKYVQILSLYNYGNREEFKIEVNKSFEDIDKRDIMLFVHGFNVDFKEAARRTAQMAYDLSFQGIPMFYSWPSKGKMKNYVTDTESIRWSTPHFQEFLNFTLSNMGAKTVHLIAHSMGSRMAAEALSELNTNGLPQHAAKLKQVILAAPDISVPNFKQLAKNFPGKADQITIYSSKNDKALIASREVNDIERAGGSIVIVEDVYTIDASNINTDFLNHSYFGSSIVSDIYSVVNLQLPPWERNGLIEKNHESGKYWEMNEEAFAN